MRNSIYPKRWQPEHPDRIQLYSLATPNGKKVGIALEEMGLAYEPHLINIMQDDQFDADYLVINPNNKIPSIVDPDGPDGHPIAIMESGAILFYLAEKTGKFIPTDPRGRSEVLQWVFFQAASVGPMFGQFGHFYKFAKGKTDDYGQERYGKEVQRLLGVLDKRLEVREWLCGDYSIADMMTVPWIDALDFYEGKDFVNYDQYPNVIGWVQRFNEREAVKRGVLVNGIS